MRRIGYIARRVLDGGGTGRVAAVFQRSLYLEMPGGWICLAAPELGCGPLTLTGEAGDTARTGMPASVTGDVLRLGPALRLPIPSRIWKPPPVPPWTAASLARGLDAALAACQNRVPMDGLGVFLSNGARSSREARAAAGPVALLGEWLAGAFARADDRPPAGIAGLVGLGPGLTPSGDDFLGGVMVAARALGRGDIAARLHALVTAAATGPLSRAHLAAAREGAASAPLHRLLHDILAGRARALPHRLAALDTLGHSSGWDAFAGIAFALAYES